MILYCAQRSTRTEIHLRSVCKVRRRGGRTRLVPDFRFRPRNPLPCVGPRAHWGGWGMGCRPRRRGVPLRRPVSFYAFFGKASQCPGRGVAHFCARPRPAVSGIPYAGMPDLFVGPAKSDLRLKIAYGCSSLRGRVPHDGGRVCACPSAVTLKAAVSRAAESDCQTDRTRRLSAVIRRRDRSGSSRPRSERRAFTVPAAP